MTKYAIKKGERYFTEKNGGWSKDIYKAYLMSFKNAEYNLKEWPKFFKNCEIITIRETYLREEV